MPVTTGYKKRFDTDAVVRLSDNMIIGPEHTSEWAEYQTWLAEGNVAADPDPLPYMPPMFIKISSTSNPSLNGEYTFGADAQQRITSVLMYIQLNNTFPGGASTLDWVGADGITHTFTSVDQFKAFANAIVEFSLNVQNQVEVPLPINIG